MKLATRTRFYDNMENLVREVGDKFDANNERYLQIYAVSPYLVEVVKEETKKNKTEDKEDKKKAKK